MHTPALEHFAKGIFGLSYTRGILLRGQPAVLLALKKQAAAFCETYSDYGPNNSDVQSLGSSVEGGLLQCQTLSILQQKQVDSLIDELHALLNT